MQFDAYQLQFDCIQIKKKSLFFEINDSVYVMFKKKNQNWNVLQYK